MVNENNTLLRITLLGTGTSFGVPQIGCDCAVCTSTDPRNRRSRASALVELPGGNLLIDSSTDLRQQALAASLERIDAVLYTHSHADHIMGADDLRAFNRLQRAPIPCYGSEPTLAALARSFFYIFEAGQEGGGKPKLTLHPVAGPFELLDAEVVPVPVRHGEWEIFGYRIGSFAYVTDVSAIPAASRRLLGDLDLLVLGALRYRPHPTHFSLTEALAAAAELGPRRTVLTHLAHDVDHAAPEVALPPGVELGHDGLVLTAAA